MEENQQDWKTTYLREEVSRCESIEELRERILPILQSQKAQWSRKIHEIITESGLNKSAFAELCGVSRMAVNKWCNGSIPKNRETFIRIGMLAGYDREKMDQLLQRYGQYPALYPKSLEDCICIFVLNQKDKEKPLIRYNYILNRIKENIIQSDAKGPEEMNTVLFDEKLSDLKDESELEQFISEHSSIFATAYHKFYAYVKMHIMANFEGVGGSVFELANEQRWSSSLRQCVSAIRQNSWYPSRNKIISLGLHLYMDEEQIDEMLALAYMEPLCAKNIFESVILFILVDGAMQNLLDTEAEDFEPEDFFDYAREVMETLNIPEVESFLSEIPEMEEEW